MDPHSTMSGLRPFGVIQDVPANAEMHGMIIAKIGRTAPTGLISHIAIERAEGGLRYVDVWETENDWRTWMDAVVEPAVGEILEGFGLPHDHSLVHTEV